MVNIAQNRTHGFNVKVDKEGNKFNLPKTVGHNVQDTKIKINRKENVKYSTNPYIRHTLRDKLDLKK